MLLNELLIFKNKKVRDLAWVLKSPSLFLLEKDMNENQIYNPDQNWFNEQHDHYLTHLKFLDKHPEILEVFLSHYPIQRLGFYFEALWLYWGKTNSQYRILHHNFNIDSEGKTLGSLDFILKNLENSKIIHLEVCVKFYLAYQNKWYGPQQKDRLDLKFEHLKNHQIPLGQSKLTQTILSSHNLQIEDSWFISKGMLFHHSQNNQDHLNPNHLKSWWLTTDGFLKKYEENSEWKILPKANWLSVNQSHEVKSSLKTPSEIIKSMDKNWIKIARFKDDLEIDRIFIVKSDWLKIS